jgi:hypothetical protein
MLTIERDQFERLSNVDANVLAASSDRKIHHGFKSFGKKKFFLHQGCSFAKCLINFGEV